MTLPRQWRCFAVIGLMAVPCLVAARSQVLISGIVNRADSFPLPVVLMNGILVPLYYANTGQNNVHVPLDTAGASAPALSVGDVPAAVLFPGLARGFAGLYQIDIQVPARAKTGKSTAITVGSKTSAIPVAATETLATFSFPELFGVSWPDQPIEFRYDGGAPPAATTRMLGPGGAEVPYQWVTSCSDPSAIKGCILIRSDLPANSNYSWTLQSGMRPKVTPVHPVRLATAGANWEITNGLTGTRIVTASANTAPWNLAPIQGVLLPGSIWTGAGALPNLLYSEAPKAPAGCIGCGLRTPMYTATGYRLTILDSGPLKTAVKATYTFQRPQYAYGRTVINTGGTGHYTIIVTVYANSKSILIDEDSDMQFSYYVPLYKELTPDQSRFRGHDSVSTGNLSDAVCGYEGAMWIADIGSGTPMVLTAPARLSNGQSVSLRAREGTGPARRYYARTSGYPPGQFGLFLDPALTNPASASGDYSAGAVLKPAYRGQTLTPTPDAYLDLTYTGDRPASYNCSPASYRKLLTDYPSAGHAAAWYSMLYRAGAGANAPVVGFYTGRASLQNHAATGPSLPGIYTSDSHWITGSQAAGIQVDNLLRAPDAATTGIVHRNWAIWVSTQADLLAPESHQPIADDQNSLTGINLSRLYTYQLSYPDPAGGWTWQYLSPVSAARVIALVRNGTSVCGSPNCYFDLLRRSEGSIFGSSLLNLWHGNSTAAVQMATNTGVQMAQRIVKTLAAGDNHFDGPLGYYQLGLNTSPETAVLNAVLMDSNSTPAQRTSVKAALALFGSLFWDNDWFPIDNSTGESVGLANQIQQYLQYRTQSAAVVPSQPFLASKMPAALGYPIKDFAAHFSFTGAPGGSTHYQSAFFEPLILNFLSLSLKGALSMSDPKWAAYAKWELSIQTPPEPRFGNLRKSYSNGDGNTEADVRTGLLGTALYPVNPVLAGNLMWAWQQSNGAKLLTEDSQFVTTIAAIDPTLPAVVPQLSSINIPGYHSVERFNFGTPNETAVWFINGDFYSSGGHRHADDGQVSIYAHSAPLAVDWNANLYSPRTEGRFQHNSIVFDAELNHPWSSDNAGLSDAAAAMKNPENIEFAAFGRSSSSTATFTAVDGTVWTRAVRTMAFDPAYPIIDVNDSFAGPGSGAGKTLTWNLMASGAVSTPAGPDLPAARFSTGCQSPAGVLPSNGIVSGLAPGLNEFSFTGATWKQHATKGINWDLFTLTPSSTQQFIIGNWGHGCQASREAGEYREANGTPFAEIQDILRIHGSGPFTTVILPYRKTESPHRTVSRQPCGVQIDMPAASTCFNTGVSTFESATLQVLTIYDSSPRSAFGIAGSGGPQEVAIQPGGITWTIAGTEPGARVLTLPEGWYPNQPLTRNGNTFSWVYPGGAQAAPVTILFTATPPL